MSSQTPDFSLPFASLFTQKNDPEVALSQDPNSLFFTSFLPKNMSHLLIPSYTQTQQFIPATVMLERQHNGSFLLQSTIQTPTLYAGNQKIAGSTYSFPLFSLSTNVLLPVTISLNGSRVATITKFTNQTLTTTLFTLRNDNNITLSNPNNGAVSKIISLSSLLAHIPPATSMTFSPTQTPLVFRVQVPKVTDNIFSFTPDITTTLNNCSPITNGTVSSQETSHGLTVDSHNADGCFSYFDKHALTGIGYAAFIESSHTNGQPLSFWADNPHQNYAFSQVQLGTNPTGSTSTLILPPLEPNNLGYSFHFDNTSIGQDTINTLQKFSLYPIPYTFLQSIQADSQPIHTLPTTQTIFFDHLNPSLYTAAIPQGANQTLILSAAYNPGWSAYTFPAKPNFLDIALPFLFGTQLPQHEKINNWENGWQMNTNQTNTYAVMVFLPQYLEYLGFGIFLSFLFSLIFHLRKKES